METSKIIIIGGRGTAIVIAEQINDAINRFGAKYEVLGLALDDRSGGDDVSGYPILCGIPELNAKYGQYEDVFYIYSLYRPDVMRERTKILNDLHIPSTKFINFIHPSTMIAPSVKMGYGNVILYNTVINANAVLGNFNTINSGCLIGHDTTIGDNNFIAGHSAVGSGLNIGCMNFIGLNSSLRNGLNIGDSNIIAMGSNIVKEINSDEIWVGNPGVIKSKLNNPIR